MEITRQCPITGKSNAMKLNVTSKQLYDWNCGTPIHVAMPNLTPGEREFIKTGITPDTWKNTFG